MRPNGNHDVHRRQWHVPQPRKERHENNVCHEIEGEGQCDHPADLTSESHNQNEPETDDDYRIENCPNQPDGGR